MLETVDFTHPDLEKDDYKRQHDALVGKLVVLQQQARSRGAGSSGRATGAARR